LKTHCRLAFENPSASWISGSAIPMIDVSRMTRNWARLNSPSAHHRLAYVVSAAIAFLSYSVGVKTYTPIGYIPEK